MAKKELAALLNISKSQLSQWLAEGMPGPENAEGAKKWVLENKRQRTRGNQPEPLKASAIKSASEGNEWEDRLSRARQTELETHRAYMAELNGGSPIKLEKLLACHSRAVQAVGEAEQIAFKVRKDTGDLATREEFRAVMKVVLEPIRQSLDGLPINEASRCNPAMPDVARKTLEEWRDKLLTRIMGLEVKL